MAGVRNIQKKFIFVPIFMASVVGFVEQNFGYAIPSRGNVQSIWQEKTLFNVTCTCGKPVVLTVQSIFANVALFCALIVMEVILLFSKTIICPSAAFFRATALLATAAISTAIISSKSFSDTRKFVSINRLVELSAIWLAEALENGSLML